MVKESTKVLKYDKMTYYNNTNDNLTQVILYEINS